MKQGLIWLASYPRSGNTLLRTVLWQCFGLKTGSVYSQDLGDNLALQNYVGHIEHAADGNIHFPAENANLALVKTHGYPRNTAPAIYVVRDGRAAVASLWQFYQSELSLESVVLGQHRFRTWSEHLAAWNPWQRPNTLLLRYEDMVNHLPVVLQQLSRFLERDIRQATLPAREQIAAIDGSWVKTDSDWHAVLSGELLTRFTEANAVWLERAGYD